MHTESERYVVVEVEKANYGRFTRRLHDEIGHSLAGCSHVQVAWVAAEDRKTPAERHYLQFALRADGQDIDALLNALLLQLEREHRVKLALAAHTKKSDVVPPEIVSELGLKYWSNPYVSLDRKFGGRDPRERLVH